MQERPDPRQKKSQVRSHPHIIGQENAHDGADVVDVDVDADADVVDDNV